MITHQMIQAALDELHTLYVERGGDRFTTMSLDFRPHLDPQVYIPSFQFNGGPFFRGDNALEAIRIARQAVIDLPSKAERERMVLRRKLADLLDELRACDAASDILADFENPLMAAMDRLSTNALTYRDPPDYDEDYILKDEDAA
jgi:hypothetical protein